MKRHSWILGLLLASLVWVSCNDDDDDSNDVAFNAADETFMESAARQNLAEIQLGELAAEKGNDSLVRAFGDRMATEHTTAQNELQQIADDFDAVDWPTSLDDDNTALRDSLMNLEGWAFDSVYMHSQVEAHEESLEIFRRGADQGANPQSKAYAGKYLPRIQQHLEEADTVWTQIETNHNNDSTDVDSGT